LAAYETASAAYPGSRPALIGRISTLGDLGRAGEMEPLLQDLAKRAPNDLSVTYLRARLAAAKGDWEGARKTLQGIEARMDEVPQSRLLYGRALAELKQHEQAITVLRGYVRRNPGHRLARRLLAEAQLGAGDAAAAVATIRPFATRPQATSQELSLMAAAGRAAGSPDAAAYAARAQFPSAEMLASELALADSAMKREDWHGAALAYRRIVDATDGRNVLVLNNLAYVEGQLGNTAAGLKFAKKALDRAPNNPSVLDTAGWLTVRSGDRAGGLALLRKAARLAPDNPAIARHLAEAGRD
jgi:predicted Zn-dependent protease